MKYVIHIASRYEYVIHIASIASSTVITHWKKSQQSQARNARGGLSILFTNRKKCYLKFIHNACTHTQTHIYTHVHLKYSGTLYDRYESIMLQFVK